ncbi:hypothetical protein PHYC_00164 [Phycisphaerales bacterium]|nr:hypothetical protein PHYC_00164 [Phycisphaerales bacterium]
MARITTAAKKDEGLDACAEATLGRAPEADIAGWQFKAELDAAELSERNEPGPTWTARGELLSRSHLVIRSRTLAYPGRKLIVAVHLIDAEPVGLLGKVKSCEYQGDGLHKIVIELEVLPKENRITEWLQDRVTRRR